MRTRIIVLPPVAAATAAAFAALSQAGGGGSAEPGLQTIVRRALPPSPPSANPGPIRELAPQLPSFARARVASDAVPAGGPVRREVLLFGARGDVDAGASRRVHAADGRAVFAAPSPDRDTVCFALTDEHPDAVWAHNFCGSSATLRARPLIWSVSVARSDSDRRLVFAWGIASRAVTRVVVTSAAGAVAATPNDDGIFLVDLAGRGAPSEITAEDARGRVVQRDAVPGASLG